MGNKESIDSGIKLSSSFSAQHHIVHVDDGHSHGQSSPLDVKQAFTDIQVFDGHLQSLESLNDRNDNGDDFKDDLVARGSSIVACCSKPRVRPNEFFGLPPDFSYDKEIKINEVQNDKENKINDVQKRDLVSSKTISTTAKKHGKNDNADRVTRHRSCVKVNEENNQMETSVAVESNGKEHVATREISRKWGKTSMDLQNDLKVIQNVRSWNHGSKGRSTAIATRPRSDPPASIPREKPSDEIVPSSAELGQPPDNLDSHSLFSQSQTAVVKGQCNGMQCQKGLSMAEARSVESSGFSIQGELEMPSRDDESERFSSQPQHHCLSVPKEQRDKASLSVINSKREPVESDDSVILNSVGFRQSNSWENPVSETVTSLFNSNEINFERFQDCFGFCKKEIPFGCAFPPATSVGFNSGLTSNPHSQTFPNDTGQFDVQMESGDITSHSSAFSTKSNELRPSAVSSEHTGENLERPLFPHSDTLKLKFSKHSYQNLASQHQSLPSLREENNQDLKNGHGHERILPEQGANICENKERELSNGTKIITDAAIKSGDDNKSRTKNTVVGIDVCPISVKENSAAFANSVFSPTSSKKHLVVFPTAFPPASANSSSKSSSPHQPKSSSPYQPKPDFDVTQRFVTDISCNVIDNNGNVRTKTPNAVDDGSRKEESENNNKDNHERPGVAITHSVVWNQPDQRQISQSRRPEESDADLLVDDLVAIPGGADSLRRHGFQVRVDDPHGIANAFLRPVSNILAVEDRPGIPTFYDAYLLVADLDIENFGLPFLMELESWGLSIFFRNRNLVLTGYEYENLSAIVEERCNGKVIVVVSKNYPQSPQCQYLTVFARNLDPDAQKRNIVPVYIDKEIEGLPNVLKGLATIRYNQVYRRGWLKDKILGALSTPT